ncbi:protein-disulfide reductase, partial [Hydrogenophaga aromaticivorans]
MLQKLLSCATRSARRLLPALSLSLLLPLAVQAQGILGGATSQTPPQMVQAELLAHAPDGAAPGAKLWVGLQLTHTPEWHTYWKNSGDSGLPTELQWTLPEGVTAGDIAWPTPRKFPLGTLANYGYDGTVLLPVPLTVAPDFKGSHVDVQLYAAWLACRKECIPEEGRFTLRVPVQGSTALNGLAFEAALAAGPKDQPAADSTLTPEPGFLNASLAGLPAAWQGQKLEFFPETTGLIEPGAAWTQAWDGARWTARVPLSPQRSDSPAQLALVVA